MRKLSWLIVGALLALVLPGASAQAQATRTWVSGVGDDANPCSRTAPCKTFAGAISKTAAGGEISVLDPGGFGAVTITKSISIVNDYSGEAGILASGTTGVIVNAAATDVILLRGLVIDGAGTTPGLNGVRFLNGAVLHIEKCLIKNFGATSAGNGNGILFAPSGTAELSVSDTYVINSGVNGIHVQPTGAGSAKVIINRTESFNNVAGIKADGTGNTGGSNITVTNSSVSGNTNAGISILNPVAGPPISIMLREVAAVNNGAPGGLRVDGPNATIRVGSSVVTGNAVGTVVVNGGVISSYGNNQIDGNTNNGANLPTIALK